MGSENSSAHAGMGVDVAVGLLAPVGLLVFVSLIGTVGDGDTSAISADGELLNTPEMNRTTSVITANPPAAMGMNRAKFAGAAPAGWISLSIICVFFCRGDITGGLSAYAFSMAGFSSRPRLTRIVFLSFTMWFSRGGSIASSQWVRPK